MKVGFFINPIAGMGGKVGLKGTDNLAERARALGARPVAKDRAKLTLASLKGRDVFFYTCAGKMGEDLFQELNFPEDAYKVVCYSGSLTTAQDSKNVCHEFSRRGVSVILFGGGDGTARDVYDVVKRSTPILGIPCGVKTFSSVFAINPKAAAQVVIELLKGRVIAIEKEIVDINEERFRSNSLEVKRFGLARVPYVDKIIQERKMTFRSSSDDVAKMEIARYAEEFMRDDTLYILGPGTTLQAISDAIGVRSTLLGVDVVKNQRVVELNVNEQHLLRILRGERQAKIIVSPLGGQGFILGRGNQQISPEVIQRVKLNNLIIVATPLKISQTTHLLVDTGNPDLDKLIAGYRPIISGYKLAHKRRIDYLP